MTTSFMTPSLYRALYSGIASAVLLMPATLMAEEAPVDLSGFFSVSFGGNSAESQSLLDLLPDDAVFIDDAGGLELAEGDFGGLQLSEEALQEVRDYDFGEEFKRENTCVAPSVAFYMQAPFPIEIHQGRDLIVMEIEYFDLYRTIFMDGRDMPESHPHSKSGYSIGHWEDSDLVVETSFIASSTFLNNGFDHSDDIHMIERFRLSDDGNKLELTQVYEDPTVFEGKAARYMSWRRVPGEHVFPYDCDPSFGTD